MGAGRRRVPPEHRFMTHQPLRRSFLRIAIAFLAMTALVAIATVLSGGMSETQGRILATSATISLASVCAMACAAFLERGRLPSLAYVGMAFAFTAAALMIFGIWLQLTVLGSEAFWKSVFLCTLWAVAFAHGQLLCLPTLSKSHRWTQGASVACITTLGLLGSIAVVFEPHGDLLPRLMVTLAILIALLTLVVPILAKLRSGHEGTDGEPHSASDRLVLVRGGDGVFRDSLGQRYRVERVSEES